MAKSEFIEVVLGRDKIRRRLIRCSKIVSLIEHIGDGWLSTGVVVEGEDQIYWINEPYDTVKAKVER